ncbi:outer membrane protein [Neopusillimonas maritima]|jgi:hypothetical protein|uniref:Outer membrane protein beta-barrel domain-containing protein n=1 Tax=Neopusillimonas maritima TaxID=2026239 RepID=A0ABX9N0E4_9BURK|nr:outer membrane beta-barrel protein [Neopusillimonas maritima]RII84562.1 hypothetical protein CJO09_04990 [Neopusillimonas maritima]
MKNLLRITALLGIFVSPAVFAQAQNFEGFNAQISTGYQHNSIDLSGVIEPGFAAQNLSDGKMPLNFGVGYTHAMNERFTLGAMLEYNPLKMDTGSGNITFNGTALPGAGYNGTLKNQVSISIIPGYAFNDTTMGYLKLGWIQAKATIHPEGDPSISETANGVLLGIGGRHLFNKNVYGFAEATYASYGSVTAGANDSTDPDDTFKMKPSSYSFLVGVGARF